MKTIASMPGRNAERMLGWTPRVSPPTSTSHCAGNAKLWMSAAPSASAAAPPAPLTPPPTPTPTPKERFDRIDANHDGVISLGEFERAAAEETEEATAGPRRPRAARKSVLKQALGGLGLGPTVIGLMNDWLEPRYGVEAIRVSLLIIGLPHILAALFGVWAARTLREDVAAAQR